MIDFYIFEHYNINIKKRGVKMGFQENLRYYREKANLTPTEMAKYLNVAYNTYVGYEVRGREPKYAALCKIADLLNVSTDELLGRENNILGMNEDKKLLKYVKDNLQPPKNYPNCIQELELTFKGFKDDMLIFNGGLFYPLEDFQIPKKEFLQNINLIDYDVNDLRKLEFQIYLYNVLYQITIKNFELRKNELKKTLEKTTNLELQDELQTINKYLVMLKSVNNKMTLKRVLSFWASDNE